jgi:hypothetical protein
MDNWILAHGSGIDDIVIFAVTIVVVLGIRMVARRRPALGPADEEPAMRDKDPTDLGADAEDRTGLGDPASSHGSDLDARTSVDAEADAQPEGDAEDHTGPGASPSGRYRGE